MKNQRVVQARVLVLGANATLSLKPALLAATAVIVDGLPCEGVKKFEKLTKYLMTTFSQFGQIVEDGLYVPVAGDPPKICGYAFIEFLTPEIAASAVAGADRLDMDANHTLRVTSMEDYLKTTSLSDKYEPPSRGDFETKANLNSWLLDGRDQFVVRHGTETEVYWNDPLKEAGNNCRQLKYSGERDKARDKQWTELITQWSPKGSLLATFHYQGVATWGGEDWERQNRFMHPDVKVLDFSPCERFLVTSTLRDRTKPTEPDCICVWEVRTGKLLRSFDKGLSSDWPIFKWSHDGKYLARITEDAKAAARAKASGESKDVQPLQISVYETPGMGLLDKKSIKIDNVQEIMWSPTQNMLAYWVPERGDVPARVAIIEVPSRKIVREKHFYSVAGDIKMHWQNDGDYLCVKVSRKKTKKTSTTNYEIFCMREKDIPVETKEITDAVTAFAFEPKGNRFGIIHGDRSNNVDIYAVKRGKLKAVGTFENRTANTVFWSPRGGYCLLAGLGQMNGVLEFVDATTMESLATAEHYQCTDVEWDPSGRFVITSVTQPISSGAQSWKYSGENGYKVWTAQGVLLATVPLEACYQVMWRPRPVSLLSREQEKEVIATLREKHWKTFEAEDEKILAVNRKGAKAERIQLRQQWVAYRQAVEEQYQDEAADRADLRDNDNPLYSDDEDDWVIQDKQFVEEVSRAEELVR